MEIAQLYQLFLQNPAVETDTRKLKSGDIFFALQGPNFNGNQFALQALQAGASYAVVSEDIDPANDKIIKVTDTLQTLQDLAKYHREQLNIPVIAITGSNGKTTTKELIHSVLSAHYTTYTTQGNMNNHIGIPLTLLRIRKDAQFAVIEMGANHQKEIEGYCKYVKPAHGIITNIGKAHLEGFGGEEGVRKGKGELFDYIRAHGGSIFAYNDYAYLHEMSSGIKEVHWYGSLAGEVVGVANLHNYFLSVEAMTGVGFTLLNTQLVGAYNLPNVLCAVAVGKHFHVPDNKIKNAIEQYVPTNSRSQLIQRDSNEIILDAYNANPSSMQAAIENIAKKELANKVLIIGGMKELGVESEQEHQNLVALIKKYRWKNVLLVGKEFEPFNKMYEWCATSEEAKEWFTGRHFEHCIILIKGSRSIALEKVLA
ncbi:MAG: UDP-N-acetylmuramoyl-tripeptide--D-alanyl-D-alanine ligase [Chitinophagaceae bacterium]|jgi:UDP-N-acetylmuramoyl-tripeptide--D-alanyl-D-alanine ligase|nr:UDP-N-acetylmuramoyl-tripeptide--D-alanyl-D-alanine ligase [Chitinophagaceae bacterium]